MYSYLLKIIFRGILRQKGIFTIKVISFVVAFLFSVFVMEWVHFEQNFDKWQSNYGRIYRLTILGSDPDDNGVEFAFTGYEWIKEIPGFFPEVEEMVRLESQHGNIAIRTGDKKFNTRSLFGADSNIFEVFDVGFLQGKKKYILDNPKTVAISKSLAEKYFGGTDCLNEVLGCSQTWDSTYTSYNIVGVFEDFPAQSHFHPEIIMSFDNPEIYQRRNYVYLKLAEGAKPENIIARFDEFKQKYCNISDGNDFNVHLQPIEDIHLKSHKARELGAQGNPVVLKMLLIAALALLLIVLINYTNLQIGQYSQDFKLFFIQKTLGSRKGLQFNYLLLYSFIILTFSLILSLVLYRPASGLLIDYLNLNMEFQLGSVLRIFFVLYLILLLFTSSMGYYIIYVSGCVHFGVLQGLMLKNSEQPVVQKSRTRSILIVLQAASTICIIIASVIAVKQLNFLTNNRLGKGENNILVLKNLPRVAVDNYKTFKEELLKHPDILDVCSTMEEPSGQTNDRGEFILDGKKGDGKHIFILPVDNNFNSFYGNELIAGEGLSYVPDRKASRKYVINETAMRYLGFSKPEEVIGKSFEYLLPFKGFFFPGYISGVVKDFHLSTMEEETKPLAMYYLTFFSYSFSVKINPDNIPGAVNALSGTWHDFFPEYPVDYFFIDQLYNKLYAQYIVQSKFMNVILIVILLISNIGLLAMVTLQINRRIKEVGIRKVNGAKAMQILSYMNKSVVLWIVIAMIIAFPVSWFVMDIWLGNFVYKTNISWWVFLLSGGIALLTALLTVSIKTWRAARRNPVEALRYE